MLFERIETFSNHGSGQGIMTRFWFQMNEFWERAFGKGSEYAKTQTQHYWEHTIHELTSFFDIYHEIIDLHDNFINGLYSGEFYKKDDRGTVFLDRSVEIKMKERVKEFFVRGRLVINQLIVSELIKDDLIDLKNFMLVNDKNFEKNKKSPLLKKIVDTP